MTSQYNSLLSAERSALVIVDVQERLAPAIDGLDGVVRSIQRLGAAARRLDVPVIVTEQYPKGLGPTIAPVRTALPDAAFVTKIHFGAMAEMHFSDALDRTRRPDILVCGTEAHVCVLQTALGISSAGHRTILVEDACASRRATDCRRAMSRAERAGIEIVTTEMVIFEWMRRADTDIFRDLIKVIK